jgi:hypothetical protein
MLEYHITLKMQSQIHHSVFPLPGLMSGKEYCRRLSPFIKIRNWTSNFDKLRFDLATLAAYFVLLMRNESTAPFGRTPLTGLSRGHCLDVSSCLDSYGLTSAFDTTKVVMSIRVSIMCEKPTSIPISNVQTALLSSDATTNRCWSASRHAVALSHPLQVI